jgi:hypothetical protein
MVVMHKIQDYSRHNCCILRLLFITYGSRDFKRTCKPFHICFTLRRLTKTIPCTRKLSKVESVGTSELCNT